MKALSFFMIAGFSLFMVNCGGSKKQSAEAVATTPTGREVLLARLQTLSDSGKIAFGHHDDTAYGVHWEFVVDSSDVKAVTGDYPAIINWDLGDIEHAADEQLDGVSFDYQRQAIVAQDARGGINTLSWHVDNPVTGGTSWDVTDSATVAKVLAPGAYNDTLRTWIGRAADYIGSLRNAEGQRIPVVFRPWHEHTGAWFWWGLPLTTPDNYKALWKITKEVFDEKGIDNVVWAYSPDKTNCATLEEYMAGYPGDEYVDVLGADIYFFPGNKEIFKEWMNNLLTYATQEASKRGKIVALTETGSEALTTPGWYMDDLYPLISQYPVAYITVWRNANEKAKSNHYYVPYPGHPQEADFVEFYNQPNIIFAQEMSEIR